MNLIGNSTTLIRMVVLMYTIVAKSQILQYQYCHYLVMSASLKLCGTFFRQNSNTYTTAYPKKDLVIIVTHLFTL